MNSIDKANQIILFVLLGNFLVIEDGLAAIKTLVWSLTDEMPDNYVRREARYMAMKALAEHQYDRRLYARDRRRARAF